MPWNLLARPLLFSLSSETAHYAAMRTFAVTARTPGARRLLQSQYRFVDPRLRVSLFDLDFENPVGLAAGFDKNADWFDVLPLLGFSHIEVGTITGEGQPGNELPRLFRLPKDQALLNRLGFNNRGAAAAVDAIQRRKKHAVLGINIGKTKVVPLAEATQDYLKSFTLLFPHADYFTINVSSPNTPNLRQLQDRDHLQHLLEAITSKNNELSEHLRTRPLPILLKIAPDLNDEQLVDVINISVDCGLSGIIATNTTISRAGLKTPADEVSNLGAGGISGQPLTEISRSFVSRIYQQTAGKLPIIGVGGIMNGEDAWRMICAGASLVQVYTGFVYGGPGFVKSINRYLIQQLEKHQLDSISQAVGRDAT
jgi:dihydroorotate dehydrogenase